MSAAPRLSDVFDPRRNSLNAVRLVLAASVILWHSFPLSGIEPADGPVRGFLGQVSVDSFFAISGYLIVSSWFRRPDGLAYLRARAIRILPAFWVCLMVTAAVFAPLSVLMRGGDFPAGLLDDAAAYVWKNAFLYMNEFGIDGTLDHVPYAGVWNGSLWTLFWEFLCYLGVVVAGLAGVLRFRVVLLTLFGLTLLGTALSALDIVNNFYLANGSRFGLMFCAGALIYTYRDVILVSRTLSMIAATLILGSLFLPDYRLVAALPLAYLVTVVGAVVKDRRLQMKNDISYGVYIYGFPVQQLLATAGATALGVPLYALLSLLLTLPIAAASWFWVEKPALRWKSGRTPAPEPSSVRPTRKEL